MSAEFLVFGAKNHPNSHQRPPWERYAAGVVLKVRNREVVQRFEYAGWDVDRDVGISVSFRAASIIDDHAWTCTSTQVLKLDVRELKVVESFSHRLFNDLHHVTKIADRFYVSGTGVDSVLEFDERFQFVKRHPLTDDEVMKRHGMDADFRKIPTTKPHNAHPNFVAHWDGEIWVTHHEAGRVQSLTSDRKYPIAENRIHDGVPKHGSIWFTAVNGEVIKLNPSTGASERFDLNTMARGSGKLGWCRGIAPLENDHVLVAYSKLRPTKLRENLKWLGSKLLNQDFSTAEPTRVCEYDLTTRTELWSVDVEAHGVDAVFDVHTI